MQVGPMHLQIRGTIALDGVTAIEGDQGLAGGVVTGQHLRRFIGEGADALADTQPIERLDRVRRQREASADLTEGSGLFVHYGSDSGLVQCECARQTTDAGTDDGRTHGCKPNAPGLMRCRGSSSVFSCRSSETKAGERFCR